MKRIAWLVASSLGVLGLANLPVACVSSTAAAPGDEDSGVPQGGDSGPQGNDATVPPGEDAATSDAGVDTGVDAGPQPLTLRVLLGGAPEPGVSVVFQDATGTALTTATTGATGTVSQLVTAGSQVTVVLGTQRNPNLVTIQDVAPGDVLTVTDTSTSPTPIDDEVTTTLPASTWDAAAVSEVVYAGQCSDPVAYPLYLGTNCESAGQFPLFARAVDNTTQVEVAYTYQTGNALVPDGGLPDGDTTLPVVVTRAWSTSTATETVTGTNVPPLPVGAQGGYVTQVYAEVSGGVPLSLLGSDATTDDAGAQSAQFVIHTGYPDFVQAGAYTTVSTESGNVISIVGGATRSAPPTTSQSASFDLSTLPLITSATVDANDGGIPGQPNVTWTSAGSLSAANGIYVSAQWNAEVATDAGSVSVNGTWTLVAPPTATSVQAPALPASLAAWSPGATASWNSTPRVAAVQASFLSGYAGFRAQAGSLPLMSGYAIVVPTLPVNGTIYVSGIYPDEG